MAALVATTAARAGYGSIVIVNRTYARRVKPWPSASAAVPPT